MNQSQNENRCRFSGFKTLLASISCLVCLQALGDCPQLDVSSEGASCISNLLKLGVFGEEFKKLKTTSRAAYVELGIGGYWITWPDDCPKATVGKADFLGVLDDFATQCTQNPKYYPTGTGGQNCSPTMHGCGYYDNPQVITCRNVKSIINKCKQQKEKNEDSLCNSVATIISDGSSSANTIDPTKLGCRSGYLQKIWQTQCKETKTTQIMLSASNIKNGWDCTKGCSADLCTKLQEIQSWADNYYCTLKSLEQYGSISDVSRNGDTVSVTICGKTKQYTVTNFSSGTPDCTDS
tara:strand:- start:81 stop:962 length:882 start_codon:yes stop_codon:yes gene_type:complete